MEHKGKKKPAAKRSVILRLCIFTFVAYAAVMLVDMQVNLASRKQEAEALEERVNAQYLTNKDLQRQIEGGVGEDDVERIARDQLDYVYPDERVYIDISGS